MGQWGPFGSVARCVLECGKCGGGAEAGGSRSVGQCGVRSGAGGGAWGSRRGAGYFCRRQGMFSSPSTLQHRSKQSTSSRRTAKPQQSSIMDTLNCLVQTQLHTSPCFAVPNQRHGLAARSRTNSGLGAALRGECSQGGRGGEGRGRGEQRVRGKGLVTGRGGRRPGLEALRGRGSGDEG